MKFVDGGIITNGPLERVLARALIGGGYGGVGGSLAGAVGGAYAGVDGHRMEGAGVGALHGLVQGAGAGAILAALPGGSPAPLSGLSVGVPIGGILGVHYAKRHLKNTELGALPQTKIAVSRRWVMERLRSAGVSKAPFYAQRAFAKGTANIPEHKAGIIHNAIHNHALATNDVKRISRFDKMDHAADMRDAHNSYRKHGAVVANQHLGLGEPEHTFAVRHNPYTR